MKQDSLDAIRWMAEDERKVCKIPYDFLSKERQKNMYRTVTAQRASLWDRECLDAYVERGEELLRNPIRRLFSDELYLDRIAVFRSAAERKGDSK